MSADARARILDRVRKASQAQADPSADRDRTIAAWGGAARSEAPKLARAQGTARLNQFMAKIEAAAASVARVSNMAELPRALSHELRKRNLPARIRHGDDPIFKEMRWGTIEASCGVGRIEEPATLSRAEFGMAETGTLVLASGPDNPVTLTFLGETHFIVLRARDLCGGFEDFWARWRERGLDPRTINMVTGPSRSGDIGQVLQLGAHGPVALHILVVED